MDEFGNAIGRVRRIRTLALFLLIFLIPFPSYSGSIRDVSQSVERVKSIEPPVQFAVLGDSRDGKRVYIQLIQQILERRPHFIIHLGDMISKPGEEEWEAFFKISKAIDIPFFPVIGNHEVAGNIVGEEIYRKQFMLPGRKTYYAFRTGGSLFVILDSEKRKRKIIDEQYAWLKDILSPSNMSLKMVFIHRPLFPPADSLKLGKAMDEDPSARDDLHRLFTKTRVKAVFQGDDHRYDRMEKDQILYIISGGGGAPIYASKDRGGFFHYVWISLQKGKLEGEVVDLEGQVQDRFGIEWPTSSGAGSVSPVQKEIQD